MRDLLAFSILIAAMAVPAHAQNKDKLLETRPPVFEALMNCRAIADAPERLACFDSKVAAIDRAEKNNEFVLADKESMKEARRGLFGFSMPKLRLFGNDATNTAEAELVAKISSAYQKGYGTWTIILEDGAKWSQIDTRVLLRSPLKGMEIKIRTASMGSFFANIDGQRAIRMARVN